MASEEPLTPFGNALAGALGGVFSNAVIYPLDTVKTRIQAGAVGTSSSSQPISQKAKEAARDPRAVTLKRDVGLFAGVLAIARSKEGVPGLYKGFGASLVNTFTTRESSQQLVALMEPCEKMSRLTAHFIYSC